MGKVSKVGGGPIGGESWIVPSGMVLKFPDGLVGTPSLTFTSDTDSGFYRIGSDEIGITLGGVLGYDFSSTTLALGTSTVGKNLTVSATLGTEKVTWTAAGWDEGGVEWTVAGTPIVITHATGNTTVLTSTLASAIVANTTYKVVITYTQVAGSCTYTLGGITGTALNTTGATVTDYITAYSTDQMVITPLTTSNIVISSISIKVLTDATGDVVIDGNLTVRSPFVSPILLSVGSANNPSFAFGLESTLGWYRPVAGTMGLAISSAERLRFTAVSGGGLLEVLDASHLGGYAISATIGTPDVFLTREGAAILQLGLDAAGVTNQMIKACDRITSDGVGADLTIAAGRNRGASNGGSIYFQTSPQALATVTGTLATRMTIGPTGTVTIATTNDYGLVFGGLGTATKGIDLSGSGLSGATDYWIYNNSTNYWGADGSLSETYIYAQGGIYSNIIGNLTAGKDLVMSSGGFENVSFHSTKDQSSSLFGNSTRVGSLSLCSSNGTATITKTPHGLTLAVGELVHVTGSSTVADKGFYRIVSSTENTIVVDRVLSGTQSDVALTVYKDVIGMFATDGTNGQMLTSWSAQNKPLQIGGTVLVATSGLTSKDVYFGGDIGTGGTVNTTTTNAYVVGGGQIATTKNTGWLQVYIGTVLSWVPYWSNATP